MPLERVDDAAYLGADWVMGGRPDSLFLSGIPRSACQYAYSHAAMRNACGRLTSTDLADFAGSVILWSRAEFQPCESGVPGALRVRDIPSAVIFHADSRPGAE